MGTFKINKYGFTIAFGVLFSACGGGDSSSIEMVSKEKYEKKIEEYQSLNKRQAAIIDDNLEKSQVINNVVSELRQLTGITTSLRIDVERGGGSTNQAEEIKERLNILKNKLKTYSRSTSNDNNKELLATISNLQQIIEQKELEISQLQQQILEQKEIIRGQQNQIEQQQIELLKKQQNSWYNLGNELYKVTNELPKVKGRKDKRNIKNTRFYILNKAKECFEQAYQLGHPHAATMRAKVQQDMDNL